MPTIDDLPTRPEMGLDFGQAFNYNVWTPNTMVQLCRVPWNSDYRDIVKFDTDEDLQDYLSSNAAHPFAITRMTYARVGDPVRINLPFNRVFQYNYMKVYNPAQPISAKYYDEDDTPHQLADVGRAYYYFITDVRFLAPNTTEISVQLDVWQTFGFDINFGNCYIERGHIGIANENADSNNGRDYLTVPEGLDIGDEYVINKMYDVDVNSDGAENNLGAWVMMGIGADISVNPGTIDNPKLVMTSGSAVEGFPQGCDIVFFKSTNDFESVMGAFTETPWVTETIQFIMAIPPILATDIDDHLIEIDVPGVTGDSGAYHLNWLYPPAYDTLVQENWRDDVESNIPERYRVLTKFKTYPYCLLEMTTYSGQPLVLKPELMYGNDLIITTLQHVSPPSPRWAILPKWYNANVLEDGEWNNGEALDVATYITDFPQFTVLNNQYLNYMASNRNQISYQYGAANWDYSRSMQGNQVAFRQASAAMSAQQGEYAAGVTARNATTQLQNQMQVIGAGTHAVDSASAGAVGGPAGVAAGALAGLVTGGVQAGIAMHQNNTQNAIANTQAQQVLGAQQGLTGYNRDTNKSYADYAAQGDYQNAIAGINARVRDAQMIQPSVAGQMGGESFTLWMFSGWHIFTKIKMINPGILAMIGEYWLRYGYAINRFGTLPASLKVMEKFTYWKLKETYITSAKCPEPFKQSIRGIFEKGVTVWTDPGDIGTIDLADNEPLSGITL